MEGESMKPKTETRKFSEIGGEYAGIDKRILALQEQIEALVDRKALLAKAVREFLKERGPVEYLGTVFYLDDEDSVRTMECKSAYDEYIDVTEEIPPEENDE